MAMPHRVITTGIDQDPDALHAATLLIRIARIVAHCSTRVLEVLRAGSNNRIDWVILDVVSGQRFSAADRFGQSPSRLPP